MSNHLSNKIRTLSVFSIIAVVFIHSYNYTDTFLQPSTSITEGFKIWPMVQFFISNGITRFAVPMFFAISGYLFFRNFKSIRVSYPKKLKSRARTILVPYIVWVLLSGGVLVLCKYAFHLDLPIIAEHVSSNPLTDILAWFVTPPAFQLWFMYQLIFYIILSPIIFFLVKKLKFFPIIVFAVFWVMDISYFLNSEGLTFYLLGAYLALNNKEYFLIKKRKGITVFLLTASALLGAGTYTFLSATLDRNLHTTPVILLIMYKLTTLLLLCAVWTLFDKIETFQNSKNIRRLSQNTFIIYALHEPLLHLFYQYSLTDKSSNTLHMALYFCLPVCMIAISCVVAILLRKICKPLYSVLTGSR